MEEKDLRVRAERRQQRTERAAQVGSLAILSLLLIAATLFLVLTYTGWCASARMSITPLRESEHEKHRSGPNWHSLLKWCCISAIQDRKW